MTDDELTKWGYIKVGDDYKMLVEIKTPDLLKIRGQATKDVQNLIDAQLQKRNPRSYI